MMDDELTPAEREAFAALPREAPGGDLLEERTVRALAAEGLLRRRHALRRRSGLAWAAGVAACVLFFVAGFTLGQNRQTASTAQWGADTAKDGTRPTTRRETPPRNPVSGTNVAQSESSDADGMRYVVWF